MRIKAFALTSSCDVFIICFMHVLAHSFEKAAQYPQVYPKTLNNLATMYFKLG